MVTVRRQAGAGHGQQFFLVPLWAFDTTEEASRFRELVAAKVPTPPAASDAFLELHEVMNVTRVCERVATAFGLSQVDRANFQWPKYGEQVLSDEGCPEIEQDGVEGNLQCKPRSSRPSSATFRTVALSLNGTDTAITLARQDVRGA